MTTRARTTGKAKDDDAETSADTAAKPEPTGASAGVQTEVTAPAELPTGGPTDDPGTVPDDDAPKSGTSYLNVSGGPVTYTKDGRVVGDAEWTPPVNLDELGQRARRAGLILPQSAL